MSLAIDLGGHVQPFRRVESTECIRRLGQLSSKVPDYETWRVLLNAG